MSPRGLEAPRTIQSTVPLRHSAIAQPGGTRPLRFDKHECEPATGRLGA
jgi:hypothetical protein